MSGAYEPLGRGDYKRRALLCLVYVCLGLCITLEVVVCVSIWIYKANPV